MRTLTPAEKLEWIRQRLAEGVRLPPAPTLMNTGARRTPQKRVMLQRLRETAEARGMTSWPANS